MSKATEYLINAFNKGYRVDEYGNVTSPKNKKLTGYIGSTGYYIVSTGKVDKVFVHRLAGYQKFGDEIFKEGVVVRHLNGNSLDNSFNNIEIGSFQDNMMDKSESIRSRCALYASSFIKKHNHIEILKRRQEGANYKELMKEFNISSKGTLSFIINNSSDR